MTDFLQDHLGGSSTEKKDVQVVLTYAQSLDGCIAGRDRTQMALSGAESMAMTHSLRLLSDAIVVGSGTLLNDDPGLNARIPALAPLQLQPTPVLIDPHCRTSLSSKVIANHQGGKGKAPILLTYKGAPRTQKRRQLEESGVRIEEVLEEGVLWKRGYFDALSQRYGFKRFMVEGGASVIKSLLVAEGVADTLVVTVSPTLVGSAGVSVATDRVPELHHKASRVFGKDVVFIADL